MSKKFTALTLATVTVIIAAAIFASLRAPQSSRERPLFFSELKDRLGEVSHIQIKSFDTTINLSRNNKVWGVDEFDGYPALPDKVKSTIIGVADLKLNGPKTALERLYPRLGVEGPIKDGSISKLLTLMDDNHKIIIEVIIGGPRRSSTAQSTPGFYIREPADKQSYLVDGVLEISDKPSDWIDRSLIDIPAEAVKQVSVKHMGLDAYTLYKSEKGQESFELEDLPADKKLAPDIIINRFGAILANVQISSVRKSGAFQDIHERIFVEIQTFDGLKLDMQTFMAEGRPYAQFVFNIGDIQASKDKTDIKTDDFAKYVADMNHKLGNWVFEIQGFKYDIVKNSLPNLIIDK